MYPLNMHAQLSSGPRGEPIATSVQATKAPARVCAYVSSSEPRPIDKRV